MFDPPQRRAREVTRSPTSAPLQHHPAWTAGSCNPVHASARATLEILMRSGTGCFVGWTPRIDQFLMVEHVERWWRC